MTNAQMTPIDAERNPIVFAKDGEVFANSRDVAMFFDKRHDHILRDIDNLISQEPKLRLTNFGESFTEVETGNGAVRQFRTYNMDRDGFSLLAMGFTGSKALKWKLAYIKAFNAMQAEIERQAKSGPMIDMNDPAALRGLLLSYSEKAIELQKSVEELQPKAEALSRLAARLVIETAYGDFALADAGEGGMLDAAVALLETGRLQQAV